MPKGLILKSFLIVILLLTAVAVRVVILQRLHFVSAESHYSSGNYKLAIREYDTAMHLYVPFSPYTERSAQRLWDMGRKFEEQNRLGMAHMAYSSLRSSFYAIRGLYAPGRRWIQRCDEKLAALRTAILFEEGKVSPQKLEYEMAGQLEALRTDMAPSPMWSLFTELGFVGFIASVLYTILKGFDPHGRPRRKQALTGAALSALSFAFCIFALYMA